MHFFEADTQEHLGWPAVYDKAMAALNPDPENPQYKIVGVVADKAFANKSFIGFNTDRGIASITPTRKLPNDKPLSDLRDPDGLFDEWCPEVIGDRG